MSERISRVEALRRLRGQVDAGKPILLFGAGTGITARSAELGGADIIAVYSTAIYRMRGLPSLLAFLPYSDANEHVRGMAREILPAVQSTPCIVGVGAHDPSLDLDRFLGEMLDLGFCGVTNEPFAGIYGPSFAAQLESAGIGFGREVDLIERARRMDALTAAWVFTEEEARIMANAGADIIGAHVGVTAGGTTGARDVMSIDQAKEAVLRMAESARGVNAEVIVLTHGGPFKDPETAEASLAATGAAGYAAGSSGERLPTEHAVSDITRRFKKMRIVR
jgi:predicted TIM-barrel enzyme